MVLPVVVVDWVVVVEGWVVDVGAAVEVVVFEKVDAVAGSSSSTRSALDDGVWVAKCARIDEFSKHIQRVLMTVITHCSECACVLFH